MVLACHNLKKAFLEQVIVKNGSFHIEEREINHLKNDHARDSR